MRKLKLYLTVGILLIWSSACAEDSSADGVQDTGNRVDTSSNGNTDTVTGSDIDTDRDTNTESDAESDIDSDTVTDTATPTDTATDTATQNDTETPNDSETASDKDGDGWSVPLDCDDGNAATHPNAPEIGDDEIDNDCDGQIDEEEGTQNPEVYSELWYSSDNLLVHIEVNSQDGTIGQIIGSEVEGLTGGQNCITMLQDGSLLGARLSKEDWLTYFYHIPNPPRDGSPATAVLLGTMKDDLKLEALYTDCDGRIYGMDTGEDDGGSVGNQLLRFTGNILDGDFSYEIVSDLSIASVADIDDMSPGIDATGKITDNPGFAIDSGTIYDFNYETGTGEEAGSGGSWGIHVLGGDLFTDGTARVYLLDSAANIYSLDPVTGDSEDLGQGPKVATDGYNWGWSGLAGPLTECETGFTIN